MNQFFQNILLLTIGTSRCDKQIKKEHQITHLSSTDSLNEELKRKYEMPLKKKSKKVSLKRELTEVTQRTNRLCLTPDVNPQDIDEKYNHISLKRSMREISREVASNNISFFERESLNSSPSSSCKFIDNSSLSCQDEEDLQMVFNIFDKDGSGLISFQDLEKALRFLRFRFLNDDLLQVLRFVQDKYRLPARSMFNFETFCKCITRMEEISRNIRKEIEDGFDNFDCEQRGEINLQNLKFLNKRNNLGYSNAELREMLELVDNHGKGTISKEEFVKLMSDSHIFS